MIKAKQVRAIIRKFVSNCYGQSELNNPSWNIMLLAGHLADALNETLAEEKSVPLKGTELKEDVKKAILDILDEEIDNEISLSKNDLTTMQIATEVLYSYLDKK